MWIRRLAHVGVTAVLLVACGGLVEVSNSQGTGSGGGAAAGAAGTGAAGAGGDLAGAAGSADDAAAGAGGTGAAGAAGAAGGGEDAGPAGAAGAGAVAGGIPGISCEGTGTGLHDCGPDAESCCTRPLVSGGTFYRDYDGVIKTDKSHPATVSDFRLDKYEITVGRFRNFLAAWDAGWRPAAGTGKHVQLNGGQGLVNIMPAGGFETGWRAEWSALLPATRSAWDTALVGNLGSSCDHNWTADDSSGGRSAMACVTWYESYAFCLWDGGFLPSETEWNYAAAGGDQQRVYPWSAPPTSADIDCSRARYGYDGCNAGYDSFTAPVGERPAGDGRWGQADLTDNAVERTLDGWWYVEACDSCAAGVPDDDVDHRGAVRGSFAIWPWQLYVVLRHSDYADDRDSVLGARCAYSP